MASSPIPDDVAELLATRIDSVAELEVLLFLQRRPDAEWDPNAVADLLYLDRALTVKVFEKLAARGFLTSRDEPLLLYRYQPVPDVAETLDRTAELYVKRRLMIIATLASRRPGPDSVRLFSRAFRFRKET